VRRRRRRPGLSEQVRHPLADVVAEREEIRMLLDVERVRGELAGCVHGADEGRVGHRSRVWSDPVAVLEKQGGEHRQGAPAPLASSHRRRQVKLWGIVISRLEDGQIVEDWAASDSLDVVRQLGVWRSVLLVVKHWRLLRS
jgi:hypothetical protein